MPLYLGLLLSIAVSATIAALVSAALTYLLVRRLAGAKTDTPEVELLKRPSRARKRYVAFEVMTAAEPSRNDVEDSLLQAFVTLYGNAGLAESGLKLIDYNPALRRGVLRVRAQSLARALAAMGIVRKVGSSDALIAPIAVSGTLKGARSKAFGRR